MRIKHLFRCCLFLSICIISCKKEDTPAYKGSLTISSRKYGMYYVKGYSFEDNRFVDIYINTTDADIVPGDSLNISGTTAGIILSVLSNNPYGFCLNARHTDLTDANAFFNNYINVYFPSFYPLTYSLKPYDVYTLKTINDNYVKFLVTDIRKVSDYFEADMTYVIQRDGSEVFPE